MAVVTRCTIKNCILTAKDDLEPYWMVEFDQQYTVAAVEFISAEKSSEENNGKGKICVYVSGILADWSKTLVLHQNKVKQQMKNKTNRNKAAAAAAAAAAATTTTTTKNKKQKDKKHAHTTNNHKNTRKKERKKKTTTKN